MGGKPSKQEEQKKEYTGDPNGTLYYSISGNELSEMITNKKDETFLQLGGANGIAKLLETDVDKGICDESYSKRQEQFGKNRTPDPVLIPFWKIWFDALKDKTLIILIIAAIVSLILAFVVPNSTDKCLANVTEEEKEFNTDWIEGLAILAAVLVASLGASISDYSKQKKFLALSKDEKDVKIKVIRNGEQQQISIFDLCVGDIVNLDVGDLLPADGVFVHGNDLRLDESDMTGESVAVKKSEKSFYMMSGTKVTDGNGKMLVVAVGPNSMWGKTMEAVNQNKTKPTPLQENLDNIALKIGYFGMAGGALVFIALTIYYIVSQFTHSDVLKADENNGIIAGCLECNVTREDPMWNEYCEKYSFDWSSLTVLIDYFILAVTIIVAAVPEGLPLAVTISLAYSMKQMFKDNNLVRHLKACETMSNCTNICSDKTGTLTENRMTVVNGWFGGIKMETRDQKVSIAKEYEELINMNISINSSPSTSLVEENGQINVIGNKTEGALLMYVKERGVDYLEIRKRNENNIYQMFAFSSAKKRMNTLVWIDKPNTIRMFTKGAPEMILEKCQYYMNGQGEIKELTEEVRQELEECQAEWASKGYRTLSLSYKDMTPANPNNLEEKYEVANEEGSILLSLFGIEDPVRREVPGAVATCQRAGIIVRMVTGDNIATARSIAQQCNIISRENDIAIEGPKFAELTDEEIIEKLENLRVIARCSPQDKERLVKLLISQGEVVAVTGDGTNDVPALKAADVGLAMGIRGTDVAKQASDIVILDDNFQSIVNSVKWGRCVYDNIRKFLQFQLTVNVSAVVLCIIGSVFVGESPLNALQMLWVNMIMDTLAALALGTEKPTDSLLDRKPFGRFDSLISFKMLRSILFQAAYQLIITLTIVFAGKYIPFLDAPCGFVKTVGHSGGEDFSKYCAGDNIGFKSINDVKTDTVELQTLVFNMFVFAQIFNLFNSRKVNGEHNIFERLFTNWYFLVICGGICICQIIIVQFLGILFDGVPFNPSQGQYGLSWQGWVLSIASTILTIVVGQISFFIPVPASKPKKFKKESASLFSKIKNKFGKKEYESIGSDDE
ncbi:plasma membrane calcium-transporting ATPase putative [Entamoeba histolytica]|uniref:Calcium-transporting ATPase n=7 Tax=Entamoeba histolytica TaxID=5759 RepID=C4M3X0_ENTH1|nr:Plasma membrane calcium-transporting ATPase, putative [Entamoeba histolytica HM-1:IMSS]EAL48139.1 Plasma membrane calcium-transporting ATPase, putative [Entamoeba histolytica HM-1:IMSS]GAT96036.1 plasma membrane calcium-transporting ATPase putative [Entamoeba histolytica]|eukprot:XP_653525.1 Plasma membrane calcium-transporting ATPase, putative [Entamoeba histolytica HM-1:IMSS]